MTKKITAMLCLFSFALSALGDCAGQFVLCFHDAHVHIELSKNHDCDGISAGIAKCSDNGEAQTLGKSSDCIDIVITQNWKSDFKKSQKVLSKVKNFSDAGADIYLLNLADLAGNPNLRDFRIKVPEKVPPPIDGKLQYSSVVFII